MNINKEFIEMEILLDKLIKETENQKIDLLKEKALLVKNKFLNLLLLNYQYILGQNFLIGGSKMN